MQSIIYDVGLVIIAATLLAFFMRWIKQPLILAFIGAGILIGPSGLGLISNTRVITSLSEFGIAFLLFTVGLELDFRKLKQTGSATVVAALSQMFLAFIAGFSIGLLAGFSSKVSIYTGLTVSFASTAIILNILSEKVETNTLHGRFQIGILLIEDVFAVFALALLTTLDSFSLVNLGITFGKGLLLLLIAAVLGRFLFPVFLGNAAKNQDLLFLASVSLSFFMAFLAIKLGFSIAMGAFLAGISIASLPYSFEIVSKMKSLKDFFTTIFFVALGMQITFTGFNLYLPAFLLITTVMLLTPIVVTLVIAFFGYGRKVSFLTGIGLSQASAFSLVIAAQGLELNHIKPIHMSLIAISVVVSMTLSTYLLKNNYQIYNFFSKRLKFLDKFKRREIVDSLEKEQYDFVLIGYDRIGYNVLKSVEKIKKSYVIIDYNPETILKLKKKKISCIYGDGTDPEILEKVGFDSAKIILSTIPVLEDTDLLIKRIRAKNKKAILIVTAKHVDNALKFYDMGADYVILPYFLGGEYVSLLLETFDNDLGKILYHKVQHINQLKKRKEEGHKHPSSHPSSH